EAIQDSEWKYIRYYRNDNLSAMKKIEIAQQLGIKVNRMLYGFHDTDIAQYRHYIESPLEGEVAVYEELFHLKNDPKEVHNLAQNAQYQEELERLRAAWKSAIVAARGEGVPKVLRYTVDSQRENRK
ncbi:MAG: acetylglucosamine-6-sulfatase, partial [Bacteroidota bacterium]